jgi:heat shock protein HslJ
MMKTSHAVPAFALALVAIAACQSNQPGDMPDITQIQDRVWVAETIEGQPVSTGVASTLTLGRDGRASGSTGCNRYTGGTAIDGAQLHFGQLAMTKMACLGPAMAQETHFTQALARTDRWSLEGETLLLHAADSGIAPSRFKPQS